MKWKTLRGSHNEHFEDWALLSQFVNLPELLDYQVINEHPSSNDTYKMIKKSKPIHFRH